MDFSYIQNLFDQIPVFVLVLFRMGGLMASAPLLGSMNIPIKIKIMLTFIMSMAIFGMVPPVAIVPKSYITLAVGVGCEMLIGISLGFILKLLFVGFQMGAEIISQQMALSLSSLIDPQSGVSTTIISQFFLLLATLIYVLINGHLILIRSLAQTFQTIPLMGTLNGKSLVDMFVSILNGAFQLSIRIAGPTLVAIFLATLALGFISRTMPQLNILAAGFPLRITLALIILISSLSMACVLFEDSLLMVFRQIGTMFI